MQLAIIGTGTEIGKTTVTTALVRGLRQRGRRVWIHKPVACGEWDGISADDGRRLRALAGDDQPPATVCPLEFAAAASPHLAAAEMGATITAEQLLRHLDRCRVDTSHDLLVEGAGGLCSPLTSDRLSLAELLPRWQLPAILVTRPDLGTLHATVSTVRVARSAGIRLLGLIINQPTAANNSDSLAIRTAGAELTALTELPVLCWIRHHGDQDPTDAVLAAAEPPHHRDR